MRTGDSLPCEQRRSSRHSHVQRYFARRIPFSRTKKSWTCCGLRDPAAASQALPWADRSPVQRRMPTPTVAQSFRILATIRSAVADFSDLVHYVRTGDFVRELLLAKPGCERVRLRAWRAVSLHV